MASTWARHLPVVTVPQGTAQKNVTLVLPYYCNEHFLQVQAEGWRQYPHDLLKGYGYQAGLSVIVVDDGSPEPATFPDGGMCDVRMFRIETDVRWNWLAARNIGAHHAADGWLLLTDMDHVVPDETLRPVVYGQHDPKVVYAFSRVEHTGEQIAPHSASFLMTRNMFWTIGGYDEALSGHYGTDGEFRRRIAAIAPMRVLSDPLVRYEFVADSSTTRYLRKQPEDAAVARIVAARGPGWRPKVLSFAYHEVTAEAARVSA
jgi:hypothetical protein